MKTLKKADCDTLEALGFNRVQPEPVEMPNFIQYRREIKHSLLDGLTFEVDCEYIHVYCREATLKGPGSEVLIKIRPFNKKDLSKLLKDFTA